MAEHCDVGVVGLQLSTFRPRSYEHRMVAVLTVDWAMNVNVAVDGMYRQSEPAGESSPSGLVALAQPMDRISGNASVNK
jgi:hypothetical protein